MSKPERSRDMARVWWGTYGPNGRRSDPGAFARLRRAEDVVDALIEPVAVELVRKLVPSRHPEAICRAAELAALLSHVRQDDGAPIASRLRGRDDARPVMSSLRFQKLMKAAPGKERLTLFRRAIALLGGRANIRDLTDAWLYFDDSKQGQGLRVDWLLRYAGATRTETDPSAQSDDPTEENDAA